METHAARRANINHVATLWSFQQRCSATFLFGNKNRPHHQLRCCKIHYTIHNPSQRKTVFYNNNENYSMHEFDLHKIFSFGPFLHDESKQRNETCTQMHLKCKPRHCETSISTITRHKPRNTHNVFMFSYHEKNILGSLHLTSLLHVIHFYSNHVISLMTFHP